MRCIFESFDKAHSFKVVENFDGARIISREVSVEYVVDYAYDWNAVITNI